MDFFDSVPETYGIDSDLGVSGDEDDAEGVVIPPTEIDLSSENIGELQSRVNPLSDSDEFGVDLFMQILQIVEAFTSTSI